MVIFNYYMILARGYLTSAINLPPTLSSDAHFRGSHWDGDATVPQCHVNHWCCEGIITHKYTNVQSRLQTASIPDQMSGKNFRCQAIYMQCLLLCRVLPCQPTLGVCSQSGGVGAPEWAAIVSILFYLHPTCFKYITYSDNPLPSRVPTRSISVISINLSLISINPTVIYRYYC